MIINDPDSFEMHNQLSVERTTGMLKLQALGECVPDPSARSAGKKQPQQLMLWVDLNQESCQQQLQALTVS